MSCIFYATSLINNLSDVILWNWTGMPVNEWMAEVMRANFAEVLTRCINIVQSSV